MTTETKLAFGHPELRAGATSGADFPDRISVRGHIEEVEIGAFQAERGNTQRLKFDLVVEVHSAPQSLDDDVDRILSYDALTGAIATELAVERLNLLETLAERIAARILLQPQALRVFVRIEKLDRGTGALGVEIVRGRDALAVQAGVETGPRPLVVYLQNVALTGGNIGRWIDLFETYSAPVVLCVGLPDFIAAQTVDVESQRHIDLLQIEQTAWMLAGNNQRCTVVCSRTELDWAMKHDQLSIWAPSKMVLDAVAGPTGKVDGFSLAVWLSAELEAERMIKLGADAQKAEHQSFDHRKPDAFA